MTSNRTFQWITAAVAGCFALLLSGCPVGGPANCRTPTESCTSSTECCGSGICTRGTCDSNSCMAIGMACERDTQCCGAATCSGGECAAATGGSTCSAGGGTCTASSDCCGAGLCTGGTCDSNSCMAIGMACERDT
ncbi:MAG: hypothetical protein WCJ30_06040, partial [Deltaproteobacteria bacterium]